MADLPPSSPSSEPAPEVTPPVTRSWWPIVALLAPLLIAAMWPLIPRRGVGAHDSSSPVDGRAMYARCQACHGTDGSGIAQYAPSLVHNGFVAGDPDPLIHHVLSGTPTDKRGRWGSVMPAFANQMNNYEIAAVINYIRSTWTTATDEITPEAVRAIRDGGLR